MCSVGEGDNVRVGTEVEEELEEGEAHDERSRVERMELSREDTNCMRMVSYP